MENMKNSWLCKIGIHIEYFDGGNVAGPSRCPCGKRSNPGVVWPGPPETPTKFENEWYHFAFSNSIPPGLAYDVYVWFSRYIDKDYETAIRVWKEFDKSECPEIDVDFVEWCTKRLNEGYSNDRS